MNSPNSEIRHARDLGIKLLGAESRDHAVEPQVFAAVKFGMEPAAQLEQRGHAPFNFHLARACRADPGDDAQERGLFPLRSGRSRPGNFPFSSSKLTPERRNSLACGKFFGPG